MKFSGPCSHGKCPILIRLVQGGRELDSQATVPLGISATFRPTAFKHANGAGDPLAANPENVQTYISGDEENSITVVIRHVRLTPKLTGVLIDLRFGFEHVKRMHEIVAATGGKLRKVWSTEEGAGPTYSTTALSGQPDGHDRLVYFSFFNYPDDGGADKISVSALSYDSATRSFQADKARLPSLLAGPYPSIIDARAARSGWKQCRVRFSVLPRRRTGKLRRRLCDRDFFNKFRKPEPSGRLVETVCS